MTAPERYKKENEGFAIAEALRSKIPASISISQGMLESGFGSSDLARDGNNHFGIKCHSDWYGEHVFINADKPNECFRKYPTAKGSFIDHSEFLKKHDRYNSLFDLGANDYIGWANGLEKAGYSTGTGYAKKLIFLINTYKLQELDKKVLIRKIIRVGESVLMVVLVAVLFYLGWKYKKQKQLA